MWPRRVERQFEVNGKLGLRRRRPLGWGRRRHRGWGRLLQVGDGPRAQGRGPGRRRKRSWTRSTSGLAGRSEPARHCPGPATRGSWQHDLSSDLDHARPQWHSPQPVRVAHSGWQALAFASSPAACRRARKATSQCPPSAWRRRVPFLATRCRWPQWELSSCSKVEPTNATGS